MEAQKKMLHLYWKVIGFFSWHQKTCPVKAPVRLGIKRCFWGDGRTYGWVSQAREHQKNVIVIPVSENEFSLSQLVLHTLCMTVSPKQ